MDRRKAVIPLCRHTKTDGHLCGSPAMTASAFCYFHRRHHRTGRAASSNLHLRYRVPLRDRDSIQQMLSTVVAGIASGDLRPAQAGRMLYALQMALLNLDNLSTK